MAESAIAQLVGEKMAGLNRDDALFTEAKAIADKTVEQYVSRPQWGDYNFEGVTAELNLMLIFARDIALLDETAIPEGTRNTLLNLLSSIKSCLESIDKFNIKDSANPKERYESDFKNARTVGDIISEKGMPLVASAPRAPEPKPEIPHLLWENFSQQIEKADKAAEAAQETVAELEPLKEKMDGLLKEAEEATIAVKRISAQTGASEHEEDFAAEVRALQTQRRWWLLGGGILLVAAVGVAFKLTELLPPTDNHFVLIQQVITKVFIVGVLAAAMVWCGSNYRALSHLLTINRHRMNALRTFSAFTKAADTAEVRQVILLETTRTIFGSTPTGFLPAGKDKDVEGGAKLLEIVAKLSKSGGAT